MSLRLKLRCGCGCAAWPIRTHFIKKSIIFLLKVRKDSQTSDRYWERMPSLRTLLEYCKFFKIITTEDQEDQPKQDGIYDSECPKPPAD